MADTFDAANSTIDASRAALLAAMAKAGSAGKAAYESAQADLAAQRQASVSAALSAAAGRNAPGALQAQLAQTVGQPYDRGIASLKAGAASRAGDLAARQANSESYLTEVQGAMPVVRAQAERQLAELRARAAREAADDSLARDKFALDREKFEWEKSQGGAEASLTDTALERRLLGAARYDEQQRAATVASTAAGIKGDTARVLARTTTKPGASASGKAPTAAALASILNIPGAKRGRISVPAPTPTEVRAQQLGIKAGLDPARVLGLPGLQTTTTTTRVPVIDRYAKAAGLTDRQSADVRRNPKYTQAQRALAAQVKGKTLTRETLAALLNSELLRGRPLTQRLLAAEAEAYL